ncbi:ATP-binding protein [Paenibacillus sp. JCM 10914]|uniref:hybrid sensor histidine kinase/response regulator n=1 Tax=Paenibacillus sp. JCM 10914 TaxID=1236974 RepID=UPI0003CC411B|nr:ATP-binding protein [Paenibacillus sp. JCM 10914]GAE08663.1 adenylate cyclase [Paenibacillus sp. JCM 10914]
MLKKRRVIIIGLTLVILLPLWFMFRSILFSGEQPQAVQGRLDLKEWDFSQDGAVELNGEWEFYRGQLLTSEELQENVNANERPSASMVAVPGKWNSYIAANGESKAQGIGTYRLVVSLRDGEGVYGVHTGNIRTAHRLFIQGQEVGASGSPGVSAEVSRPDNVPYFGFVQLPGGDVEIMVQVSNFVYSSGGIFTPILFGDKQAIMKSREAALFLDAMTLAGFLIPAMYFLLLYRMQRHERSLWYLGLFCLAAMVYVLTHGQKLLAVVWPDLPYEWFIRIQMIFSAFTYYYLLRYITSAIHGAVHRWALNLSLAATIIAVVCTLLLPTVVFSQLEPIIYLFSLFIVIYVITVMVKAIWQPSEDKAFMFVSVLSIVMIIVVQILSLMGVYDGLIIMPLEMLMFVVTQALLLAQRFSRAFDEVDQLSRKLLTLDGLKDEFMANTSHELRTPLHGIVNMAQSLLEGASGKLNGKQAKELSIMVSTGRRLSTLVNDILDFGKLKNGEIELRRQPVNLQAVTTSVLEVVSHLTVGKPIDLKLNWPESLPWLDTDEDRLRQILYNLLGNSVKFTEQGTIEVQAAPTADGFVQVSVKDTGIGIARERLTDIFQSYDQIGYTSDREYSGMGIGLSITRKLVELGGGTIWAESTLGIGSIFHFTLPQSAAVPPLKSGFDEQEGSTLVAVTAEDWRPAAKGIEATEPTGTGATVLLVDDDPVNLHVLRSLLALENYRLITVDNGQEALKYIRSGQGIDLVITDWMMPGMTGLQLCRSVREQYTLFELPVLMLTARSLPEDVRTGLQAGANDFLRKPVEADELRARVRNLLELRRSVRLAISSEMAFLQAQIKPHFMFNALNTIIAVLYTDPDKATQLLIELSHYLRGSFDFQNRDQLVTLDKELALVRSYIFLEQARFEDRLKVEYDVRAPLHYAVPPLSIQPIVENAVRHGVTKRISGGTVQVVIDVLEDERELSVMISDNGIGMSSERIQSLLAGKQQESGVGLRNINSRLLTLYGKGLRIESEPEQGTRVCFRAPFISRDEAARVQEKGDES